MRKIIRGIAWILTIAGLGLLAGGSQVFAHYRVVDWGMVIMGSACVLVAAVLSALTTVTVEEVQLEELAKTDEQGFTLLEVVISCLIITVLAAIALPNAVRAKAIGQEVAAVTLLKTTAVKIVVSGACATTSTFSTEGYTYTQTAGTCSDGTNDFTITATPTNSANHRQYYVDQGPPVPVVHYSDSGAAGPGSPALQ